ncbi:MULTISPECIES: 3TM-type holin [unclassified Haematospirillum]|uniref:3TM-type holin n=1 Tax=unclassified Haematospirillum TaxID=2622088 RepID=UPI00143A040E|nr:MULTISPECIES: 3TM-type holin [unclassified Haematospirillum]NKD55987.1 hypothetical protein [Haematospirillum sp. H4890]NKD75294.1 hypothetical protein [Haematospirillum sp. H4485]
MGPVVTALLPILGGLLDRIIPNSAEAAKIKIDMERQLIEAAEQAARSHNEVNKIEAASGSSFRGGWRPFIGWVCGCALAFQFFVGPLFFWAASAFGLALPPLPQLDSMLMELIFTMLGVASLRTVEKMRGVT